MLTSDLIALGKYLYGENWQEPLAFSLGISNRSRTVKNWLLGAPIKDSIAKDICRLVRMKQRDVKIEKILEKYE